MSVHERQAVWRWVVTIGVTLWPMVALWFRPLCPIPKCPQLQPLPFWPTTLRAVQQPFLFFSSVFIFRSRTQNLVRTSRSATAGHKSGIGGTERWQKSVWTSTQTWNGRWNWFYSNDTSMINIQVNTVSWFGRIGVKLEPLGRGLWLTKWMTKRTMPRKIRQTFNLFSVIFGWYIFCLKHG